MGVSVHQRLLGVLGVCVAALAVVWLLAGCGGGAGSSSTTSVASAAELQAAKRAGEEKAREQDRVKGLQKQMRALKHRVNQRAASHAASSAPPVTTTASPSEPESGGPLRSFHAPSGNVSCQIYAEAASCTVDSIGETFVFEAGGQGRIESVATLPRGLGELVGYGSTVSAGSVTCEVPPSDVPRGITCSDSSTGHGFEASRVESRQSAY